MDIYDIVRHYIRGGKKTFQSLTVQEKRQFVVKDLMISGDACFKLTNSKNDLFRLMGLALDGGITPAEMLESTLDDVANRYKDEYEKHFAREAKEVALRAEKERLERIGILKKPVVNEIIRSFIQEGKGSFHSLSADQKRLLVIEAIKDEENFDRWEILVESAAKQASDKNIFDLLAYSQKKGFNANKEIEAVLDVAAAYMASQFEDIFDIENEREADEKLDHIHAMKTTPSHMQCWL